MTERTPGIVRLVATLGLAGLFSGLAIVVAYEVTLPRIRANRARALREAVLEVVPGAVAMRRLAWRDGELAPAQGGGGETEGSVFAAFDGAGRCLGFAIPAKGPGFQDTIALIYGLDPVRRRVLGMRVLESRETPGLGDRIYKDPEFVAQFEDLAIEPEIVARKKGAAKAPNEIDAITGATISSKAVVRILNAANRRWLERLPDPSSIRPPDAKETRR